MSYVLNVKIILGFILFLLRVVNYESLQVREETFNPRQPIKCFSD